MSARRFDGLVVGWLGSLSSAVAGMLGALAVPLSRVSAMRHSDIEEPPSRELVAMRLSRVTPEARAWIRDGLALEMPESGAEQGHPNAPLLEAR
jgi:hypothetical protein